mmetsp:Transcript_21086/g.67200  ORF Transcript_21086/g.67200 Transcript_21086/m.67200 type:complete len:586 (-) Transcript_21086:634-2391(-)
MAAELAAAEVAEVADGDAQGLAAALRAARPGRLTRIRLAAGGAYPIGRGLGNPLAEADLLPPVPPDAVVEVDGRGARLTRTPASGAPARFWSVAGTLRLRNLDLANGRVHGAFGGAIAVACGGSLRLEHCSVLGCSAAGHDGLFGGASGGGGGGGGQGALGGAIFSRGGHIELVDCTFFDNTAHGGAGGIANPNHGRFSSAGGQGGGPGGGAGGSSGRGGQPATESAWAQPGFGAAPDSTDAKEPARSSSQGAARTCAHCSDSGCCCMDESLDLASSASAQPRDAPAATQLTKCFVAQFTGAAGGGGGGSSACRGSDGGCGAWGGGGGGAGGRTCGGYNDIGKPGRAGFGGGDGGDAGASSGSAGGGGAAAGGAVCCIGGGSLRVERCVLQRNACVGGSGGSHPWGWPAGRVGQSFGGAIFVWGLEPSQVRIQGADTAQIAFNSATTEPNIFDLARVEAVHVARRLISNSRSLVEVFSSLTIAERASASVSPEPAHSISSIDSEGSYSNINAGFPALAQERSTTASSHGDQSPLPHDDAFAYQSERPSSRLGRRIDLPSHIVRDILECYVGWELEDAESDEDRFH